MAGSEPLGGHHYPGVIVNESETRIDVTVVGRRSVTDDIAEITLESSGREVPRWGAGAHIDVILDDDTIRQYSLCGLPEPSGRFRIAVLREDHGRGGSILVHETLVPGVRTAIHLPRNHFPLVRASSYVFVAGGIGITPMLALVAAAQASGRPWRLVYTGRGASRMAYADELSERYPSRVRIHDSTGGRIDLRSAVGDCAPGTAVYCCGPEALLADVEQVCDPMAAVDVFHERFVPRDAGIPLRSEPFDVHLAISGKTLTVPPDRSILDVALAHDVMVLSSCREGTCGTCEVDVVSGEIDHRDSILTPEERSEGESMMICVSRAASPRLVLEL
ncbi:oxidoreductase [Rhodococcus sp. WS4]|nr:oxidoreductase [Rhodococcus sp. WS4]